MLNVVLVSVMAICFLVGIVIFFFPFGKETMTTNKTAPATKSLAQVSLEGIRDQARQATATDVHIFVMWYKGFQGYRSDIPASVRYLHMLEWRARVDELFVELPVELVPLWNQLVHGTGYGGDFSQGFR